MRNCARYWMKDVKIFQMMIKKVDDFYLDHTYDGDYILFHIPSLSIYIIDKDIFELFKFAEEKDIKRLMDLWKNSKIINENKDQILKLLTYNHKICNNSIKRLALLIAQECPLSCKYCYANHGVYNVRGMMSFKIVKETLKKFYHVFDSIETLQFFGGEPLLNLSVIRETLEFLTSIGRYPVINIESGLGVDRKRVKILVNMIKKYEKWFKFELVISIDGPEFIQNRLRPFKSGKGSYDTVRQNMEILRIVNQPRAVEVTYTQLHERNHLDKEKIIEFFKTNFGIENIIIVPVVTNDEILATDVKEEYRCEKYLVKPLKSQKLPEDVKKEIQSISGSMFGTKPDEYYCGAGVNSFVIDIKGDVYPCQMVVGVEKFKISNVVKDINNFEIDMSKAQEKYIKYVSKLHDRKCSTCFLRYTCGGCVFADVYLGISDYPRIPHEFCDKRIDVARKLLRSKFWEVLS